LGNKEEVFNGSVVVEGGSKDLVIKLSVPQDINGWEEIFCLSQKCPSDTFLKFHVLQQGSAFTAQFRGTEFQYVGCLKKC